VLANVPTYMVWDDHDIRDGWGSSAGDSPTLAAQHPAGQRYSRRPTPIRGRARRLLAFSGLPQPAAGDYRDSALPGVPDPAFPNYIAAPPSHGQRLAMPFVFRCGA